MAERVSTTAARPATVVVGGGIGGLAAAHALARDPGRDVLLLEGSPVIGGKLRLAQVAGVEVDVGAEAMLNRRPEGVALARELGLPVVHPATAASQLWSGGGLRPLPRSLMGVPLDLDDLAASGVLSDAGLARVRAEPTLPPTELIGDVSVAQLVGDRLGHEVVERLVEPLLGGVYAGHAASLSARATTPQLVAMLDRGSLVEAARAAASGSDTPVFAGIPGGMGSLAAALAAAGGFTVRTDAMARELRRTEQGFELVVGPTRQAEVVRATDVVLATPATPTSRLLADLVPAASAELAAVETASVAILTFAFRAAAVPQLTATTSSGFLVPPVEGRRIKAATFSFAKWDWVRESGAGLLVLRTSLGRHREEAALQHTDDELAAHALADLAAATGVTATPVDVHVQRWGGGLPQYAVGHLDRVERIRAAVDRANAVTPTSGRLSLCGATYDGVGIPAVIASAERAAAEILDAEPAPDGR